MSKVGKDYGVAWWMLHRVLVATAADALGPATPTSMIGIDETRARSAGWLLAQIGWRRTDPRRESSGPPMARVAEAIERLVANWPALRSGSAPT